MPETKIFFYWIEKIPDPVYFVCLLNVYPASSQDLGTQGAQLHIKIPNKEQCRSVWIFKKSEHISSDNSLLAPIYWPNSSPVMLR